MHALDVTEGNNDADCITSKIATADPGNDYADSLIACAF